MKPYYCGVCFGYDIGCAKYVKYDGEGICKSKYTYVEREFKGLKLLGKQQESELEKKVK